jgi:alpha-beta hydrolase superfamily lysophospholipase
MRIMTVMTAHAPWFASFVSIAAFVPPVCAETGPEGTWTGQWERDESVLNVEMTFARDASGYTGSFSSAELRVVGIPLAEVRYEAPRLRWQVVGDATRSSFEGSLHGDTLNGSFREGSASGTFALVRGTSAGSPAQETDASFTNGAVTLSGTVVSPSGSGPFAGVVFLHGSGAEGRWASRYLAHEIAKRGIAGLIYDKRGVGRSGGDWRTAGFADLVGDATAAVATLRARSNIDPERVGIHGHSQGATIAPWVASADPRVAFVAASAAGGVPMAEMEIYSLENSLGVSDLSPAERDLATRFAHAIVATAYQGAPRADLERVADEARGHAWAFELPPPSDPYWSFSRSIAAYDPLEHWRRVTVPVLLLYGEEDERVPARLSARRIADAYLAAKGPRLDVMFFPLADHNYRWSPETGGGSFAWPRTVPEYPQRLIDWLVEASKPCACHIDTAGLDATPPGSP